ncbi:MAG: hypothetical protein GXO21_05405 [Aquificae bacterium]|nr:hypothetical protein [Aquificota bacterium]
MDFKKYAIYFFGTPTWSRLLGATKQFFSFLARGLRRSREKEEYLEAIGKITYCLQKKGLWEFKSFEWKRTKKKEKQRKLELLSILYDMDRCQVLWLGKQDCDLIQIFWEGMEALGLFDVLEFLEMYIDKKTDVYLQDLECVYEVDISKLDDNDNNNKLRKATAHQFFDIIQNVSGLFLDVYLEAKTGIVFFRLYS